MAVSDIIAYLGGSVVLTVLILKFFGRFFFETIADKWKIEWSGEQEKKLELLRAEINHEHSIFAAILNSYSSSHQFSQSNRIKAVQTLWDNVLETRKISEIPSFFFGILLENEYNTDQSMKLLNTLSFENTIGKIPRVKEDAEKSRPFLGEHLWSLFVIYTILVGRVSYLLIEGKKEKDIKSWHKDEHIQSILKQIFDETERNSIISKPIGSFGVAMELLEQKILFEMLIIISGELAAESDFSNAKKFQELIKQEDMRKFGARYEPQ